ncbi:MAG TPA: hypothetical protein VLJ86_00760 [Ramlibacter sp.]|nr:hypothetical protein [Ramlibacter sp.]
MNQSNNQGRLCGCVRPEVDHRRSRIRAGTAVVLVLLTLSGITAAGAVAAGERTAAPDAAARLLLRASASLDGGDLTWARLQWDAAQRLDPATAANSPLARRLLAATKTERALAVAGQQAADRRDLAGVQAATQGLRQLDSRSPLALSLTLRYQAAMADRGGAFNRVRWAKLAGALQKPPGLQSLPASASKAPSNPHAVTQ